MDKWYAVTQIHPQFFHINDNGHDSIWLVVGSEKALLIDTGWGVPGLKTIVSELTPLPVIIANSHGHPDHSNGNYQFERVLIHPEDTWLAAYTYQDDAAASQLLTMVLGNIPQGLDVSQWRKRETALCAFPSEPLDLGDIQVRIIHTPGHTRGSVSFFIPEWRTLILGDTLTHGGISCIFTESADLATYQQSLYTIATLEPKIDAIYCGHGKEPVSMSQLHSIIRGISQIKAKQIEGCETEMFGVKGLRYSVDAYTSIVTKPIIESPLPMEQPMTEKPAFTFTREGNILTGPDAEPFIQALKKHFPQRSAIAIRDRATWARRHVEVTLENNEKVFFKIDVHHGEAGWLQAGEGECHEKDVAEILETNSLPQVIPPVLAVDYACDIIPYPYIIQSCMGGTRLSDLLKHARDVDAETIYETLGQFYRQLHSIHSNLSGIWNGSTPDKPWGDPTGFLYRAEIVEGSGKRALEEGQIPRDTYNRAVMLWAKELDYLKIFQPTLIHYSAFQWNVYLDQDTKGWRISKIMSVGDMMWGDPAYDLACLRYPPFGNTSQAHWKAFLRGYGSEPERKRMLLYTILQTLCAAMGSYWAPPSPDNATWAKSALANLDKMLDEIENL